MAITVIKPSEMGNHASFGQELGQSLGQGFQGALRGLAEGKVADLLGKQQERKMHKQRENLVKAGYSESDADAILAGYSPEQIKLMQILNSGRGPQGQENAMQIGQPMGQPQGNDQNMLSSLLGQSQQGGGQQDAIIQNLMKMLQTPQQQQQMPQMQQQAQPQMQQMPQMQTPQQSIGAQQKVQPLTTAQKIAQYETPADRNARLKREQQERHFEKKENREERKLTHTQQKEADAETLPVYKEINKEAKAAKANDLRLDRMEKLISRGSLTDSRFAAGLNGLEHVPGVGKVISSVFKASYYTPDSMEFEKLTYDFLKDAKSVFGSRLTNFDVESYLKTVPSLALTDTGKKRVIGNLRLFNKASEVRQKTMDKIIEDNHGVRPRNLESLIDKRASKDLDDIADQFKSGIHKK